MHKVCVRRIPPGVPCTNGGGGWAKEKYTKKAARTVVLTCLDKRGVREGGGLCFHDMTRAFVKFIATYRGQRVWLCSSAERAIESGEGKFGSFKSAAQRERE